MTQGSEFSGEWGEEALEEVRLIIEAESKRLERFEAEDLANDSMVLEIDRQISQMRAEISKLQETRRELGAANSDRHVQMKDIKRKLQSAQARENLIKENEAREAELLTKVEALEALSEQFKWSQRLFKFQKEDAFFLANAKRALLANVPGLGKTITSLAWLDLVTSKRTLIIPPAEVQRGFQREILAWADHRNPYILGGKARKNQFTVLETLTDPDYLEQLAEEEFNGFTVVMNYEALTNGSKKDLRRLIDLLKKCEFDTVIIDEAHRIKNMDTASFKAVKELLFDENMFDPSQNRMVRSVENVLMMTGTPILNRPLELFPLLYLINSNIFYSESMFKNEFCTYNYTQHSWVLAPGGKASLQRKLAGFYLRRTYEDAGIVLPPQEIIEHDLILRESEYPKQVELINMLRKQAAMKIDEQGSVFNVQNMITLLLRERQACTWPGGIYLNREVLDEQGLPVYGFDDNLDWVPMMERIHVGKFYQESIKMDRAVEIFEESRENGQRVIFASKFKEALKEIEKRLAGRIVRYDGDTAKEVRREIQEDFLKTNDEFKPVDDEGHKVHRWEGIAVNYDAAGVGLTLTGATVMVILDSEWNPGKNEQMYARIQRIGQDEQTQIHKLVVRNSADEYLEKLVSMKAQIVDGFNVTMSEHIDEMMKIFRQNFKEIEGGTE